MDGEGCQCTENLRDKTLISTLDDAIAIVLPPDTGDAAVIGHQAQSWLNTKVAGLYACRLNFDSTTTQGTESFHFSYRLYVRSHSPHWLVGRQLGAKYCGEDSQIQSDQDAFVWDLNTGEEVNPWTWIANSKTGCPETCHNEPPSALRELIVTLTPPNPDNGECKRLAHDNDSYFIWPTSRGFVFAAIVYPSRDCDFETEVPYASLQPFLTDAGKLAAKSFVSEKAPDLHTYGL